MRGFFNPVCVSGGRKPGSMLTGRVSADTLVGVMGCVMLAVGILLLWQA